MVSEKHGAAFPGEISGDGVDEGGWRIVFRFEDGYALGYSEGFGYGAFVGAFIITIVLFAVWAILL